MTEQSNAPAAAQIQVTKGKPTAEELAAVTALLTAMGSATSEEIEVPAVPERMTRLRKRRALSPRLGWSLGRR
ncbi:acyl-CoA carboxylase subunit epsilon [Glutamicibacter ardleyensis]|uniref:Acyl-CoA carboxylase subunit epsilon n=1 Tax=Glutamicibacter ardleyensis TaxID=225894 RepID=A0ABQ2DF60_9MICC|nr:acyl-CoA carboxylase subunit epsilon [Glutamicibacter ardleyensis]GGJ55146.1 hypothetical protein GCM10007173_12350 [Glutamicibacter ardleyensis]